MKLKSECANANEDTSQNKAFLVLQYNTCTAYKGKTDLNRISGGK